MSEADIPDLKEESLHSSGNADSAPRHPGLYRLCRSLAYKWIHNTYIAPFFLSLSWRQRINFYLTWLLRVAYITYLYFSWAHPLQTGEWLRKIELRGGIIADGISRGLFFDALGLVTPQPGEGWEFLPPKYFIWQDEIAWIMNEDRQEDNQEVFEGWSESWKTRDEGKCADMDRFSGETNPVMTAMMNLQFDGVWKEGAKFEDWVKRMDILRVSLFA